MATLNENVERYSNYDSDLRELIVDNGGTIPTNTPCEDLLTIIESLMGGGTDSATLKAIIEGQNSYDLVIPDGITAIRRYCFHYGNFLRTVTIPSSVVDVGDNAFGGCANLITANVSAKRLQAVVFSECQNLTTINLANTESISDRLAAACPSLTTVNFPNTLISMYHPFYNCPNLEYVTVENGFNCNRLDLSISTKYSASTIVSWLNALADRTGQTTYTLTIGTDNINKLTTEQIAIATNKNWNLA